MALPCQSTKYTDVQYCYNTTMTLPCQSTKHTDITQQWPFLVKALSILTYNTVITVCYTTTTLPCQSTKYTDVQYCYNTTMTLPSYSNN
jgi:hypothetical protein